MKSTLRYILILMFGVLVPAGAGIVYLNNEFSATHSGPAAPVIIDIPRGTGNREIIRNLREQDIIASENMALAYLLYSGNRGRLRAGEYIFDRPMSVAEALTKLVEGDIYLHRFTVPEGLTLKETAAEWEEQGFGTASAFLAAAAEAVSMIHDLDGKASSLEGYLFPETYSFARGATAREAVAAMVDRFKNMVARLKQVAPPEEWPQPLRETVILASLIEAEAALADERPIVSSVYLNRLARRILLQCDPTVIYALERDGLYKGRLTLTDLRYDSPYNTYRYPGLPPGPITNPGYAALEAAVKPASTKYLFFVRTTGGRHTFSENLADHNRAVREYRAAQRRGN